MSVAVIIFSEYYGEMGDAYGVPIRTDFGATYDVLSNITSITDQQETAVREGKVDEPTLFSSITSGVLVAIDFFLSIPALIRSVISDLTRNFDLPPVLEQGIMAAFIGMIVLIIITLIMKVKAEV